MSSIESAGPTTALQMAVAEQALTEFGFADGQLELISHTENAVFRLDLPDQRQVVRVHRPGYNTEAELSSILAWVDELSRRGIKVPATKRTLSGQPFATVTGPDGVDYNIGIIDWVDGRRLEEELEDRPDQGPSRFLQIGAAMATLHNVTAEWSLPPGFTARSWDADGLIGPDPLWGRFWSVPQLTATQAALLAKVQQRLYDQLREYGTDPRSFGLIHADVHAKNVLVDGDRIRIIDFDDAGFGWHVYELAVTLEVVAEDPAVAQLTDALLDGYRSARSLTPADVDMLAPLIFVRRLIAVSWLAHRLTPERLPMLTGLIDWATTEAEAYLDR